MRFMPRVRLSFLVLPFAFASLAPTAAAQCPLPDHLDCGSCWTPAQAQLPQFPAITQDSLSICWQDCGLNTTSPIVAKWGRPRRAQTATIPPLCSVYVARLDINDAAGTPLWTGPLRMWYSRTWFELTTGVHRYQVWRFLVNGDLRALVAAGTPCPIPQCAATFNGRVHYRGYADYAFDCATGQFSIAWALDHGCDNQHHVASYPRGGTFHANRSYTMVGPSAGFTPQISVGYGNGSILDEAIRPLDLSVLPGSGNVCVSEERIDQGFFDPLRYVCPCGGSGFQYVSSDMAAQGVCGTLVLDTFDGGFISKGIGMWEAPDSYPGFEMLRLDFGALSVIDPSRPRAPGEYFHGVTTLHGYDAYRIGCGGALGAPLALTFVDLGNSRAFPGLALLRNVSYVSDIILNFNLSSTLSAR